MTFLYQTSKHIPQVNFRSASLGVLVIYPVEEQDFHNQ
jgi:hypothetical protein